MRPWERPNYSFQVKNFPPGFEPQPYVAPRVMTQAQKEGMNRGVRATNRNTGRKYYKAEPA